MATKGRRRGFKFTTQQIESLLDVIEEIISIDNPDWEKVWDKHMVCYPKKERTPESLRRKFQDLAKSKAPTGDPNCPPHIHSAKRIYRLIVKATDGSDGESCGGDDDFPPNVDDNEDDNEFEGDDYNEDDKDIGKDGREQGVPVNLSFGDISDFTDGEPRAAACTEGQPNAAATTMRTSIAAASVSTASSGGNKRSSTPKGGGVGSNKEEQRI